MSYHHLTTFERGRLEQLLSLGYSYRSIGRELHRHPSGIAGVGRVTAYVIKGCFVGMQTGRRLFSFIAVTSKLKLTPLVSQ